MIRKSSELCWLCGTIILCLVEPASAVLVRDGERDGRNLSTPTGAYAGSGLQFQGEWGSFLGTAISHRHFVTASHVGGSIGQTFRYGGETYTTVASFKDPGSDLRIWQVDRNLPSFAPLYSRQDELGKELITFGRSGSRGSEVFVTVTTPGDPPTTTQVPRGWRWTNPDGLTSWGASRVSELPEELGEVPESLLGFAMRRNGVENAALAQNDSGGGLFIKDGNTWKLAGINFAVLGPFSLTGQGNSGFNASLYDMRGLYIGTGTPGEWSLIEWPEELPSYSFSTRISTQMSWIRSVIVPEPASVALCGLGLVLGLLRPMARSAFGPSGRRGL